MSAVLSPPHAPPTPTRALLFATLEAWAAQQRPAPGVPGNQLTLFAPDQTPPSPPLDPLLRAALAAPDVATLLPLLERWHELQLQRGSRKRAGQYYTPPRLVAEICETLGPLLPSQAEPWRILEPACGFGTFAAGAIRCAGAADQPLHLTLAEQDPLTAEVARMVALLAAREQPRLPVTCDTAVGDFLLDCEHLEPGSFDAVLGNPPFVASYARDSHGFAADYKTLLRARYRFAAGRINTAVCFIERALELLRPGGILALVLPSAIFHMQSWGGLRRTLLTEHELVLIRYCGEWAFRAEVPTGVLVLRKGGAHSPQTTLPLVPPARPIAIVRDHSPTEAPVPQTCDPACFTRFPHTIFTPWVDPASLALLNALERDSIALAELVEIRDGINLANLREALLAETQATPQHRRVLKGSDIQPWQLRWGGQWVWYDPQAIADREAAGGYAFLREPWIFAAPCKLIHRQTADRLIVAIDREQHCVLNSCHCSIPRPVAPGFEDLLQGGPRPLSDPALAPYTDPAFLAALYQSGPLTLYYKLVFCEIEATFPQVKTANLRQLPIPRLPVELVTTIAGLGAQQAASAVPSSAISEEIDRLLADHYGLTWPPIPAHRALL